MTRIQLLKGIVLHTSYFMSLALTFKVSVSLRVSVSLTQTTLADRTKYNETLSSRAVRQIVPQQCHP